MHHFSLSEHVPSSFQTVAIVSINLGGFAAITITGGRAVHTDYTVHNAGEGR